MGSTNITSLDSEIYSWTTAFGEKRVIDPMWCIVEYFKFINDQYPSKYIDGVNGKWIQISNAAVENITFKIGPDPAIAIIRIPGELITGQDGVITYGKVYEHTVAAPRDRKDFLECFGPQDDDDIRLFTKIRISIMPPITGDVGAGTGKKSQSSSKENKYRVFVGYVTAMEQRGENAEASELTITCKDARELLRKTPVQGVLFWGQYFIDYAGVIHEAPNPEISTSVNLYSTFIRDKELVFNEGGRPDRFSHVQNHNSSVLYPRFINRDYNRFRTVSNNIYEDHRYISDAELFYYPERAGQPHADKWYGGHIFNYLANLIDAAMMVEDDARLYGNPQTANESELPIMRQGSGYNSGETIIPLMDNTGIDGDMFHEWFYPRSIQAGASGIGSAVSAIGEFDPTGMPYTEALHELCRRVGNYTIAVRYTKDDKMLLKVIRTCQAKTDNEDLTCGWLNSKGITLYLPGTRLNKNVEPPQRPNIQRWHIKTDSDPYYNIIHIKGGPILVQCTFTTLCRQAWNEEIATGITQTHKQWEHDPPIVGPVAGSSDLQWLPSRWLHPTLVIGWDPALSSDCASLYAEKRLEQEKYEDVFRTWIIPQHGEHAINWIQFFMDMTDTVGGTIAQGFRRFLDKDREFAEKLLMQWFNKQFGVYRNRPVRPDMLIARCYRGIPIYSDGMTAYGALFTDEGTNKCKGLSDFYFRHPQVELLNDGRLGFRLAAEARDDQNYPMEAATGATRYRRRPWSWNGQNNAMLRAFDMLWTVAFAVDEEIWEQLELPRTGTRTIKRYGPKLEFYRNAQSEYGMEVVKHSVMRFPNPATTSQKFIDIPAFNGGDMIDDRKINIRWKNPVTGAPDYTRYVTARSDVFEMAGRAHMIANRQMASDTFADLVLSYIDVSYNAGDYIADLKESSDLDARVMPINALITSMTLDFTLQNTLLRLETIK